MSRRLELCSVVFHAGDPCERQREIATVYLRNLAKQNACAMFNVQFGARMQVVKAANQAVSTASVCV